MVNVINPCNVGFDLDFLHKKSDELQCSLNSYLNPIGIRVFIEECFKGTNSDLFIFVIKTKYQFASGVEWIDHRRFETEKGSLNDTFHRLYDLYYRVLCEYLVLDKKTYLYKVCAQCGKDYVPEQGSDTFFNDTYCSVRCFALSDE